MPKTTPIVIMGPIHDLVSNVRVSIRGGRNAAQKAGLGPWSSGAYELHYPTDASAGCYLPPYRT